MGLKYGRVAMSREELDALCRMVQDADTYVEIGVLWGGSLIEVLKSNSQLRAWGIDPFNGYYGGNDKWSIDEHPTIGKVIANLRSEGVNDRATLVKALSDPFPLELKFDCGLIDGDHAPEWVSKDWNALKTRCKRIAFHDVTDPEIMAVIEKEVDWQLVEKVDSLMVFKWG